MDKIERLKEFINYVSDLMKKKVKYITIDMMEHVKKFKDIDCGKKNIDEVIEIFEKQKLRIADIKNVKDEISMLKALISYKTSSDNDSEDDSNKKKKDKKKAKKDLSSSDNDKESEQEEELNNKKKVKKNRSKNSKESSSEDNKSSSEEDTDNETKKKNTKKKVKKDSEKGDKTKNSKESCSSSFEESDSDNSKESYSDKFESDKSEESDNSEELGSDNSEESNKDLKKKSKKEKSEEESEESEGLKEFEKELDESEDSEKEVDRKKKKEKVEIAKKKTAEIINIEGTNYYLAEELREKAPIFFIEINKIRETIGNKKMEKMDIAENYIFIRKINDVWTKSSDMSDKVDKLALTVAWTEKNIPEFSNNVDVKYKTGFAPGILEFKKNSICRDENKNIINIEMRGERTPKGCYFKVKDVSLEFGIKKLDEAIINKKSSYKNKVDYEYFYVQKNSVKKPYNLGEKNKKNEEKKKSNNNKKKIKKELFLTYKGLINVIIKSRSPKAKKFSDWIIDTLFTFHMGTDDQKIKLFKDSLGINTAIMNEVFKVFSTLPGIYFYIVGKVSELRKSMEIPDTYDDDDILCKYGFSDNNKRRHGEHKRFFSGIKGANLRLKYLIHVDPTCISNAETSVTDIFKINDVHFKYKDQKEIIIIDKEKLVYVEKEYKKLEELYSCRIDKMADKLKVKEHEMNLIKSQCKSEIDLKNKDMLNIELKCKSDIELKDKDILNIESKYKSEIELKDKVIELKDKDIELKDKDMLNIESKYKSEIEYIKLKYESIIDQMKLKYQSELDLKNKDILLIESKNKSDTNNNEKLELKDTNCSKKDLLPKNKTDSNKKGKK